MTDQALNRFTSYLPDSKQRVAVNGGLLIAVAILLMRSIVFSRLTVNVFVFELGVVFFVTRYMYDARRRDFALSASHFSPRGRANSRLPMKKIKSLSQKTRKVRVFVWKGIRKNTPLSSKVHCYIRNTNGLDFNPGIQTLVSTIKWIIACTEGQIFT